MLVKDVSGKDLREFSIKSKRTADAISNSPKEAPANNSPATPLNTVEVKRPRLEVSSSHALQSPRKSQPSSSDKMWTSFFSEINNSGDGNAADDHFPFGDVINEHFSQDKFQQKVKELRLERVLQTSLTDSIRNIFLLRVMGQKFGDIEKENKAYVGEITELKKMLSENEKNYIGEITELKKTLSENKKTYVGEITELKKTLSENKKNYVGEITELKKTLSENKKNYVGEITELKKLLSENEKNYVREITELKKMWSENKKNYVGEITELKKILSENEKNYVGEITTLKKKLSEYEKNVAEMTSLQEELKKSLVAREKDLKVESKNNRMKLLIKEDAHKVSVNKLNAELEKLKGEIQLQYKAGYEKAVTQVIFFASKLEHDQVG